MLVIYFEWLIIEQRDTGIELKTSDYTIIINTLTIQHKSSCSQKSPQEKQRKMPSTVINPEPTSY